MNQTKPIANASYMPQLDALRAFAVAAVAYSHWVPREYTQTWGSGGVRLFFVLSGFLITGILLRCREHGDWKFAARAFYARRFLRIVPLFYAVLFAAFIFNIPSVRETLLWHVFYLSNFYFVWNQGWNGEVSHFWSLAVEEQFYLFWPAVILCLPARYIAPSAIGLIATGVVSRFFLPQVFPRGNWWIAFPTANFDSLGVGALLAIMAVGKFKDAVNRWLIASVPIYFILFAMRQIGFPLPLHGVWEDLGMLLSFAWLVSVASVGFPGWVKVLLEIPLLLYLGRISYGLYVLHNFAPRAAALVANVIGVPSLKHGLPNIIVMAAITIGGASLSWHFFESPLNKLKRNFPYKKRPDQVVNTESPASLSLDG